MTEQIQQRTPEWFAQRVGRITASSVGAILGLSPFMKREDVMRNMVREYHNAEREFKGNQATEYGTFHESLAVMDYVLETGNVVMPTGFHIYEDWLGASPDGLINHDGLIEVKCPFGKRDKNPPEFNSIDYQTHYWMQIQIQLLVTSRRWCHFYQWSAHGEMLETVRFNQPAIDKYLPALRAFYDDYLVEREEPNCNKYLYPKRQQLQCKGQVYRYLMIAEQIKELEAEKKQLLDEIVKSSGGKDSEINGHKLTQVHREGAISYAKAVKELLPDVDLTKYKGKPTSYWRLS
jgi:putative phage-type endonuclease